MASARCYRRRAGLGQVRLKFAPLRQARFARDRRITEPCIPLGVIGDDDTFLFCPRLQIILQVLQQLRVHEFRVRQQLSVQDTVGEFQFVERVVDEIHKQSFLNGECSFNSFI